jgi:hypothetical protein
MVQELSVEDVLEVAEQLEEPETQPQRPQGALVLVAVVLV